MIKLKDILEELFGSSKFSLGFNINTPVANVIKLGRSPSGNIFLNFNENSIREGRSPSGDILLTIDRDKIRLGRSPSGRILARFVNPFVRLGESQTGKVIANIDSSNRVREGRSPSGDILATVIVAKREKTDAKMAGAAAAVYLFTKNMIRIIE
jgi:hypothetical protein